MPKVYDAKIKAGVIADFAMGASKASIAKKYNVGRTTVIEWLSKTEPPVPTMSDSDQRDHLGQLVYDYLVTGFEALIAQNRLAADPAFLHREGTPIISLYREIHAGVVAVAQAIDRGQLDEDDTASLPSGASLSS